MKPSDETPAVFTALLAFAWGATPAFLLNPLLRIVGIMPRSRSWEHGGHYGSPGPLDRGRPVLVLCGSGERTA